MTIDVHLIKDREQLSRLDPRAEKFHKIVREKTNEVLAEAIRSASVIKLTESPPTIAVIAVLGAIGDCVATMQSIMDEHGRPDCGDPNCPMDSIKLDHECCCLGFYAIEIHG